MTEADFNGPCMVVGTMSGTSLDGLDLILCSFEMKAENWHFTILKTATVSYSNAWKRALSDAHTLSVTDFIALHNQFGTYTGSEIREFLKSVNVKPTLIASHGHTVIHQPDKGLTFQIGSGASIAAESRITTIADFRSLDVALGGQGAPLVPAGDELLFNEFRYCLNIGGFANISHNEQGERIACDICPANIVSNAIALSSGKDFDNEGELGKNGLLHQELIDALNALPYYSKPAPKSLGREWVEQYFLPVVKRYNLDNRDILRNFYEHISIQISRYINDGQDGRVLVTGGGAYNEFLINLIQRKCKSQLIKPDKEIIEYKEALIFAFLGLLRYRNETNCMASVTGADADSSSGIIYRI
jgi:anhydro-N-acetylmuramic acid kinase